MNAVIKNLQQLFVLCVQTVVLDRHRLSKPAMHPLMDRLVVAYRTSDSTHKTDKEQGNTIKCINRCRSHSSNLALRAMLITKKLISKTRR